SPLWPQAFDEWSSDLLLIAYPVADDRALSAQAAQSYTNRRAPGHNACPPPRHAAALVCPEWTGWVWRALQDSITGSPSEARREVTRTCDLLGRRAIARTHPPSSSDDSPLFFGLFLHGEATCCHPSP